MSNTLKSLGHPIRLEILLLLNDVESYQFGELASRLQIESSGKLSFHLKKLQELLDKSDDGSYRLNDQGKQTVTALQAMGLKIEDRGDPTVENLEPRSPSFFDEITPAKFFVIALFLSILAIPLSFLSSFVQGAIYYRIIEERGTPTMKHNFNQYLILLGFLPIIFFVITGRVSSIESIIEVGGLASIVVVFYISLYFIGAWIYAIMSKSPSNLLLFPPHFQSDFVIIFREVIILGVISLFIFLLNSLLDLPPLITYDDLSSSTGSSTGHIEISVYPRFLMIAIIIGFTGHTLSIQFESLAELVLTSRGRFVLAMIPALILSLGVLSFGVEKGIPGDLHWYLFVSSLGLVTIGGMLAGQHTAIKFTSIE